MRIRLASTWLALVGLLLLSACASTPVGSLDGHPICGLWEWRSSGGGMTGKHRSDPASTGHTRALLFTQDGEYAKYRDGIQVEAGRYSIVWEKTIFGMRDVVRFVSKAGNVDKKVIMKLIGYKLSLSDGNPDGFGSSYERVPE